MNKPIEEQTLVEKLRTRASIRRNIKDRKSVQEGKPDRIADLLEESAVELEKKDKNVEYSVQHYNLDEQQYNLIKEAADEIESYVQFAWAIFDGEGGHDLVLYDMNEDYKDDYIKRNGEKYKDWVVPLYIKETE